MRSTHVLKLVLFVLSALVAPQGSALSARLSFDEIVRSGQTIVAATVVSSSTRWGEGHKMIWTDYELKVEETWKGEPLETLTASFAGGTVAGESILVSHVPELEVGATYVLSLHDASHLYASQVVGAEQGLFREVTEVESGRRILLDSEGFAVAIGANGWLVRLAAAEPTSPGKVTLRPAAATAAARPPATGNPTYRDGLGRQLSAPEAQTARAARARDASPPDARFPLTRAALREAVRRALERGGR